MTNLKFLIRICLILINYRKPIDSAWDLVLFNRVPTLESGRIARMFNDGDYTDTRQFSVLHKIILGLLQRSIGDELEASTKGINAIDANGRTSLYWAAARGDTAIVKSLLEVGADTEIRDFESSTALFQAVKMNHMDCVKLLLEHGADSSKRDAFGATMLHQVCRTADVTTLLDLAITMESDLNAIDYDGDTALIYATRHGSLQNVIFLLERGADPNIRNVEGETALVMAINHKRDGIVRELLKRGAKYRGLNSQKQTILHAASSEGTAQTIRILAQSRLSRLDSSVIDKWGRSCLDYIKRREDEGDSSANSPFEELLRSINETDY
jgi:ankyrin repeat protein